VYVRISKDPIAIAAVLYNRLPKKLIELLNIRRPAIIYTARNEKKDTQIQRDSEEKKKPSCPERKMIDPAMTPISSNRNINGIRATIA